MIERSKINFCSFLAVVVAMAMAEYLLDDNDFSLSGLTKEDPNYVIVIAETRIIICQIICNLC